MTVQLFPNYYFTNHLESRRPFPDFINNPTTLEYMAANDVAFTAHPTDVYRTLLTDPVVTEKAISDFHVLRDAGVNVWLEIESVIADAGISYFGLTGYTTVEEYEALFGDCMALFDEEGDYLIGYGTEGTYANGFTWMYDHAHDAGKKVSTRLYPASSHPVVPPYEELTEAVIDNALIGIWNDGYLQRRALSDQLIWETYDFWEIQWATVIERWTMDNHPELYGAGKTRGITTAFTMDRTDGYAWWDADLYTEEHPYPATVVKPNWKQRQLAKAYLSYFMKPAIGKIDVIEIYPSDPSWVGVEATGAEGDQLSIIEQIQWLDGLYLDSDTPMPNTGYIVAPGSEVNESISILTGWDA